MRFCKLCKTEVEGIKRFCPACRRKKKKEGHRQYQLKHRKEMVQRMGNNRKIYCDMCGVEIVYVFGKHRKKYCKECGKKVRKEREKEKYEFFKGKEKVRRLRYNLLTEKQKEKYALEYAKELLKIL